MEGGLAKTLSDIASPVDQVTSIPFLLEGDAAEYYHSLTKAVQDDCFELMRVLGQPLDCISHELVYLSRMLSLKESEFPQHADYVKEFRTQLSSRRLTPVTSRWVTSSTLGLLKVCQMTLFVNSTSLRSVQDGVLVDHLVSIPW